MVPERAFVSVRLVCNCRLGRGVRCGQVQASWSLDASQLASSPPHNAAFKPAAPTHPSNTARSIQRARSFISDQAHSLQRLSAIRDILSPRVWAAPSRGVRPTDPSRLLLLACGSVDVCWNDTSTRDDVRQIQRPKTRKSKGKQYGFVGSSDDAFEARRVRLYPCMTIQTEVIAFALVGAMSGTFPLGRGPFSLAAWPTATFLYFPRLEPPSHHIRRCRLS
eukprot:558554-Rhodomonas_salina.3